MTGWFVVEEEEGEGEEAQRSVLLGSLKGFSGHFGGSNR